ncbi:MAG: exosortase/archaeosortase family protein [bacterium]
MLKGSLGINKIEIKYIIIISGIIILSVYSYKNIFIWMYGRFIADDSYYSHGFLVPFVSAYLVWNKREELQNIREDHSWFGFAVILIALLIHVISTMFFVFFPSGISLVLLIFGIALFCNGWLYVREIFYPILFLFFMIPIPMDGINKIAVPLKMFVAWISTSIMNLLDIAVFRTGFIIETAKGNLLVDNPCSGLRSLISFLAIGFLMAIISNCSKRNKIFIFSMAFPIAIITNVLRVSFLILVVNYYGPSMAYQNSLPHDISGYVVFLLGGLLFYYVGKYFDKQNK